MWTIFDSCCDGKRTTTRVCDSSDSVRCQKCQKELLGGSQCVVRVVKKLIKDFFFGILVLQGKT